MMKAALINGFSQIREVLATRIRIQLIFYRILKQVFLAEEIYVYTPKGDVKMLPIGATALDFAFACTQCGRFKMYRCKSESQTGAYQS